MEAKRQRQGFAIQVDLEKLAMLMKDSIDDIYAQGVGASRIEVFGLVVAVSHLLNHSLALSFHVHDLIQEVERRGIFREFDDVWQSGQRSFSEVALSEIVVPPLVVSDTDIEDSRVTVPDVAVAGVVDPQVAVADPLVEPPLVAGRAMEEGMSTMSTLGGWTDYGTDDDMESLSVAGSYDGVVTPRSEDGFENGSGSNGSLYIPGEEHWNLLLTHPEVFRPVWDDWDEPLQEQVENNAP
ncbi:hypothetical protein BGZ94_004330 [Podila epigama]|nr:hypothetical protein BGZ94_004330 [Podila epigama]